ncbi:MAG: hypothetical protein IJ618_05975 [Prevotella sp.]|nr:hypothetical protein [Prevotella sp.]
MKKRGNLLVTRPTSRGSGIALSVRTSNAEAHADMYINDEDCIEAIDGCLQIIRRILHTHERHCCFDF